MAYYKRSLENEHGIVTSSPLELLQKSLATKEGSFFKVPKPVLHNKALNQFSSELHPWRSHHPTSDAKVIEALTEMADSQAPAISPIKSPKRFSDLASHDEIPVFQPAPKRPITDEAFKKTMWNCLASLEGRRAKCKRSLLVLRD